MVWVFLIVGVIAVLALVCVWASVSENRKAKQAFRQVKIDDIGPLVEECFMTFRQKLGLELDLNDLQSCAGILDENVNTSVLKDAFVKTGFGWRFVLPVGAFLGELVRYHRDAGWQEEKDGSLSIWIKDGQEEKTIHPFEMVLEQAFTKKGTVFTSLFTHVFPFEDTVEPEGIGAKGQVDSYDAESMSPGIVAEEPINVEVSNLKKKIESGANWFFWIAGLSLVNSILFLTSIEWGFFFGLGITQVIDSIAIEYWSDAGYLARIVAFGLDVIAASIFVLFGFLSRKNRRWAFIVGMILYGLDATLFLLVKDFVGIGVHCVALYGIFNGLKASRMLKAKAEYESLVPATSLKPMAVSLDGRIDADARSANVIWPVVVTIISLIYAVMYALVNIGRISNPWKLATCMFLFSGVLGLALRRRHGVTLLLAGSVLILLRMAYGIASSIAAMSEPPPVIGIVVMLVLVLVFAGWPSFLIIWFLRKPIRTHVRNEWT